VTPLGYAKAIIGASVLASVFFMGRGCGVDVGRAERQNLILNAAAKEIDKAEVARDEALAALATEKQAAKDAKTRADAEAANAAYYMENLNNANDKADRLAGDVRAGDVRFRKLWAQCQTVPSAQGASDSEPVVDAGANDRAASAARIVRAAAQCDAHVRALQKQIIADRN